VDADGLRKDSRQSAAQSKWSRLGGGPLSGAGRYTLRTALLGLVCVAAILAMPLASAEPCLLYAKCVPSPNPAENTACQAVADTYNTAARIVNGVTCS
jgi:hypothetical protein